MVWKFCDIWFFYGNCLPDGPNSMRFYLTVWDMACMHASNCATEAGFTWRKVVQYSCFDLFSSAEWRYFQLSGLWNTCLKHQTRRTATYVYVEIQKMLNFPSICSVDWNICAEYDLRGRLPLTETLTLMGTWRPTVRCPITRPDYPLLQGLIILYGNIRGMFEMNCLFLSGDFKFQVSPKVLISCPRSTPRG